MIRNRRSLPPSRSRRPGSRPAAAGIHRHRHGVLVVAVHDVDQVEDAHGIERAEDDRDHERRLEQRQRDLENTLTGCAVHLGALVAFLRQHLQAGEQQGAMNGVVFQTSTRITARSAVSGEAVQAIGWSIRPIAKSTWLITPNTSWNIRTTSAPRPRSESPRNQDRGAQQAAPAQVRVERERDAEAEDRLHGHRDQGEHDRVPNRAPPVGILEQIVK